MMRQTRLHNITCQLTIKEDIRRCLGSGVLKRKLTIQSARKISNMSVSDVEIPDESLDSSEEVDAAPSAASGDVGIGTTTATEEMPELTSGKNQDVKELQQHIQSFKSNMRGICKSFGEKFQAELLAAENQIYELKADNQILEDSQNQLQLKIQQFEINFEQQNLKYRDLLKQLEDEREKRMETEKRLEDLMIKGQRGIKE